MSFGSSRRPDIPTHFTETVLFIPSKSEDGGVDVITTDGFRVATCTLFNLALTLPNDKPEHGRIVIGAKTLRNIVADEDGPDEITLSVDRLPGSKAGEEWRVPAYAGQDEHTFALAGGWPDTSTLVHYDEQDFGTDGVGFHPDYFIKAIDAVYGWWEEGDEDESLPMVVREIAPNKVCTFTIKNTIGRLTVSIMPKVLDNDDI